MTQDTSKMRVRPRFRIQAPLAPEIVKSNIAQALKENASICTGEFVSSHITLKIPRDQLRFWSPQMQLELESHEGGTLIRGLICPQPGIWTLFVFFYSAIGFLTMLGGLYGLSQMVLDMTPWALLSVPVGLLIMASLFLISHIGQQWSSDQIEALSGFLNAALDRKQK